MVNADIKEPHIGLAIQKRVEELDLSKSEFGRRIGVPQQHINRIFEREAIDTAKLIRISKALDFNFFALYCKFPTNVNAYLAAVTLDGDANNNIGDAGLISQIEASKVKAQSCEEKNQLLQNQISFMEDHLKTLKDQVEGLKKQLEEKDEMIAFYREKAAVS